MKKSVGILLYLLLMAVCLRFDLRLLFDEKQFFLVLFGTVLLFLPSLYERDGKEKKEQETPDRGKHKIISRMKFFFREERARIGQNAVWAGMLQTFVLLFMNMNIVGWEMGGMQTVARSSRSILYGFCLWIILQDSGKEEQDTGSAGGQESIGKNDSIVREIEQPEIDYRKCLQEFGLTRREVEIALLVIQKESNAEIADELFISEGTVKKHMSNIFSKLDITQRQEIKEKCIAFCREHSEEV